MVVHVCDILLGATGKGNVFINHTEDESDKSDHLSNSVCLNQSYYNLESDINYIIRILNRTNRILLVCPVWYVCALIDGATGDGTTHDVMLSYCWDNQRVVHRIHRALRLRGYAVWIDVEQMQGSTVDAMAAAVEASHHVVYAVSQAYKNSSPCAFCV